MAQILDGKIVNEEIAQQLKSQIRGLTPKPKLVIIQVGDLPESNAYIDRKVKFGEKIGATVEHKKFENDVSRNILKSYVLNLNSDPSVHGIIVQMPIPEHLDKDTVIEAINPKKDVDGLTSANIKKLWENKQSLRSLTSSADLKKDAVIPATTRGILSLLEFYEIPIARQKVVIIGRSSLVGKPTFLAFLNNDATVTICHKATKNLPEHTKAADIIIVATGKPNLIGKEHVQKDQVVIDVGINVETNLNRGRTPAGVRPLKLIGDVNFVEVEPIVKAITPVPGGVGPMTVASLFQNLLQAYENLTP